MEGPCCQKAPLPGRTCIRPGSGLTLSDQISGSGLATQEVVETTLEGTI